MSSIRTAQQLIDFQQATLNHAFTTIMVIQSQAEKAIDTLFELATWYPEESQRHIKQWIGISHKTRDELKAAVDNSIDNMKAVLGQE
jgi:hypothetical protein